MSFDPSSPAGAVPGGSGSPGPGPRQRSMAPIIAAVAVLVIGLVAYLVIKVAGGSPPTASPTVTVTAPASTPALTTGPSTPSSPATSTTSASPTSTVSPTSPVPGAVTLPVYYVDEVSGLFGPRLYREFRQLAPLAAGKVATAVQAMLTLPPNDPDYSTLWPAATLVNSVTVAGGVATVDLNNYPSTLGSGHESAAVSQLVYTVTAVDPSITGVKIRLNGAVPTSGHLDLTGAQKRGNPLNQLANVWILGPTQGLSTGSPVIVKIYGTGFEGNVPLKVFQGATEVTSTHVTTMMGGFAEAQVSITLSPGTYELRAYNDNGMDASLQVWDTKTFTVN